VGGLGRGLGVKARRAARRGAGRAKGGRDGGKPGYEGLAKLKHLRTARSISHGGPSGERGRTVDLLVAMRS
jgi:hypothetical protein